MKNIKITLLITAILINSIFITGCWNYREVDKLAIVIGVAIDKGINSDYMVTVEVAETGSGKDAKTKPKIIKMEGKTLFDTIRNSIAVSGERLYWSHAKVLILSKDIASEGVSKIFDWYTRDSETREDIVVLVSEVDTAREMLESCSTTEDLTAMKLADSIRSEDSLSKAPKTDILKYYIQTKNKGMSTVLPSVKLEQGKGKQIAKVSGSAIIKDDKLIGFLDSEETKDLLFIRDEVKGGILVEEYQEENQILPISLEIFKSKTKIKTTVEGKDVQVFLNIETTTAIDEIDGSDNVIEEGGHEKLEKSAEIRLKDRVEALIKKVQQQYDADIFGFGAKLLESNPKTYKAVSNNWEEVFMDLKVNVNTKVHIKNSGIMSNTFKKGE